MVTIKKILEIDECPSTSVTSNKTFTAIPYQQSRLIHFIRHGQGDHNVAGELNYQCYKSEQWFDAHLTQEGWKQATYLNAHLRQINLKPDLVIVSPLMRALETAVAAFGSMKQDLSVRDVPLMSVGIDGPHYVVDQRILSRNPQHILAVELCREQLGVHPCDRRRRISEYRTLFPAVDWSLIGDEEDILSTSDKRETKDEITARARQFLSMLLKRSERSIAVVTHSSFLKHLFLSLPAEGSTYVNVSLLCKLYT
ncbi:hypothetical protein CEUSTIGMA_g7118.t1 [Chlamydomonas eustigma]|uniref:Phosphoglycerate mutase-like protein n=1 Tax=Chlamydomonas eustigma TaxID=1157962 RepID=A0A250X9E3_9CHLO|nr:hypothetical protein CEUSTIGMA_g7118.t1 [Chlamydomonas eustigma]|eukprot:GAX79677.1 hypothetical protein CEUSTIGMA_g7118.t1 [Chlamydomonas eustigma]